VCRFQAGESWWEMPSSTAIEQENRYAPPAWCDPIEHYLAYAPSPRDPGSELKRSRPLTEISISEILEHALLLPPAQWTKRNEMRVAEVLRYLGWKKKDVRREGRVVKRWVRVAAEGRDDAIG